ncbi:MAG: hypothetical protein ACK2UW_06710 [Anaerolineales bacterium]
MTVPFSRTLRSMNIDTFRASWIGLILAFVLAAALIAWFFLAHVTLYEYSTSVTIQPDGSIYAVFPEEAIARVRTGQTGILRLALADDQGQTTLPVLVVGKQAAQNQVEVLVIEGDMPAGVSPDELSAQLEVAVEEISPGRLVMRTSGQFFSGSQPPGSQPNGSSPRQ